MSESLKTFKVAITLCLVCSLVVSVLHATLESTQLARQEEFRQQNVLEAAGVWKDGADPAQLFAEKVDQIALNLQTGQPVEPTDTESADDKSADKTKGKKFDLDEALDIGKAMKNDSLHRQLTSAEDIAGLKNVENYTNIYEVQATTDDGNRKIVVLPVRGKGLWSTLWGFVALDITDIKKGPEAIKISGLTYYKHGETPGLGGEVENKKWKALWPGRTVFDDQWNVIIGVSKSAEKDYQVDALSGATLTSNGVTNMLQFWLSDEGFGPYLKSLAGAPVTKPSADSDQDTQDAATSKTANDIADDGDKSDDGDKADKAKSNSAVADPEA